MATTALILGIVGIVFSLFLAPLAILLGSLSLIFSIIALAKHNKGTGGLVLGILTVIFSSMMIVSHYTEKDSNGINNIISTGRNS